MWTLTKLTSIFLVVSSIIFSQSYGLKDLDKSLFSKYRVPDIKYRSFYLDAGFNYSSNSFQYTNNSSGSPDRISENYSAQLAPIFKYSTESEQNYFDIITGINLQGSSGFNVNDGNSIYSEYKLKNISYGYRIDFNPNLIQYIRNSNWFINSTFNSIIDITKREENNIREGDKENRFQKNDNQFYQIELGFGYGKIRNVTPLIQAARFRNRLMVLDKINGVFNDNAMLSLAQQFSKSSAYNTVYDRPSKYFWNDIENVLNENNVSLDGLNQYANSYLREVENELKFMRYEGYRLRSIIDFAYDKYRRTDTAPFNANFMTENSLVTAGVSLEFSTQLNLYSQLSSELIIKGGSFLTESPDYKQQYSLHNLTSYSYELTDRLVFIGKNNFIYISKNASKTGSTIDNLLTLSINYFWEDNITSRINYKWQHTKYDDLVEESNHTYNNQYITFNMTYIFTSNFLMK